MSTTATLPHRLDQWPLVWRERYEERVAMLIHDAGMDEADARIRADEMIRESYERQAI